MKSTFWSVSLSLIIQIVIVLPSSTDGQEIPYVLLGGSWLHIDSECPGENIPRFPLAGEFTLALTFQSSQLVTYDITDIEWSVLDGPVVRLQGSGRQTRSTNGLITTVDSTLRLSLDEGELREFWSEFAFERPSRFPLVGGFASYGDDGMCIDVEYVAVPKHARLVFRRGELNGDERVTISDAITLLGWIFTETPDTACVDAADSNDDGIVDLADATTVLSYLFLGTRELAPPFRECGVDATDDELSCDDFDICGVDRR